MKFNIQRYQLSLLRNKIILNNKNMEHISKTLSPWPRPARRPPLFSAKFIRRRGWQSPPGLLW
ncbi:hypothetical protein [Zobellella denitrificans]|jgi:hypothetical protein|uniref:hypothetical protein n=1 Tax=Zobellella denitrificans TaxID=347534 RepID=UPI0012FE76B6|nr:hypothetical protein [Zobellella denitrificans]